MSKKLAFINKVNNLSSLIQNVKTLYQGIQEPNVKKTKQIKLLKFFFLTI